MDGLVNRPPSGDRMNDFLLVFSRNNGSPKVCYYQIDPVHKTRIIPKMFSMNMTKLKDLCGYRVIVHQGFLYIIGGKDWMTGAFMNNVFRFDPTNNSWVRKASLIRARCRFTIDVVDGNIIVTGGEIKGNKITASVEVYDPVQDIWAEVSPLPRPRADHASCVLDGKLYVSGGLTNLKYHCSNILWKFDPQIDKWTEPYKDACIAQEREKHGMISVGRNKIYIVGGLGIDHKTNREKDEAALNLFEPMGSKGDRSSKWKLDLQQMHYPRNQAGFIRLGRKIYVIGGHNFENSNPVKIIEYYDVKKKLWYDCFPVKDVDFSSVDVVCLRVPNSNKEFCNLGFVMNDRWILW